MFSESINVHQCPISRGPASVTSADYSQWPSIRLYEKKAVQSQQERKWYDSFLRLGRSIMTPADWTLAAYPGPLLHKNVKLYSLSCSWTDVIRWQWAGKQSLFLNDISINVLLPEWSIGMTELYTPTLYYIRNSSHVPWTHISLWSKRDMYLFHRPKCN